MASKPRIKRRQSILYRRQMWECSEKGRMGMGDTPREAFKDWKLWIDAKGAAHD